MDFEPKGFLYPELDKFPSFSPELDIGVMASGDGTNFEAILSSIRESHLDAKIKLLIVNNPECNAINRAIKYSIPYKIIEHSQFNSREEFDIAICKEFAKYNVEGIVMAGWMRIVTKVLINKFPNRIINLHPSLLPSFPGYNAIKQAIDGGSLITGCSTHYVSLDVDSGPLIAQAAIPIFSKYNYEQLRSHMRYFEHKILPMSIAIAGKEWRSI